MDRPAGPPERLTSILREAMGGRPGWAERLLRAKIWEVWEAVAGGHVAAHAWPDSFMERDTLVVVVSDSVWMQQLHFERGRLLDRLNALLGPAAIKDIRFRLGEVEVARASWRTPTGQKGRARDRVERSDPPVIPKEAEALLDEVADAELKKAFLDLFITHLRQPPRR